MHIDHHPLISEFPDHRNEIHDLKSNHHFTRLAGEYETVDKSIVRIENGIEDTQDTHLEQLKKQRLLLKDQLYTMLQEKKAS